MSAARSWNVFDRVFYFCPHDKVRPDLGSKFQFVDCDSKPHIKQLCDFAAKQPGWSCIINADIIMGKNFPNVEYQLMLRDLKCAVSRRWEIPETGILTDSKVVDYGLDWFAATPEMWAAAAREIPSEFQLGKILWDTWMLGFFLNFSNGSCADLTPSRVIFHPKHGDRNDQNIIRPNSHYYAFAKWPRFSISY